MKAADSAMWEGCISVVVKEQRCDRWPKCTDKQMGMLWIFWGSMSCKASSAQVMTSEPLCEARVTSSISRILSLSRVQVLQNWDQREKTNYWTVIGAELNKHGREVKNWMERKDKTGVYFTESMNHNPIISYPATGYQSVQLFLPYCCWYLCTLVIYAPPWAFSSPGWRVPALQSFLWPFAGLSPGSSAWAGDWGCSSQGAELGTSLCWTPQGSCLPSSAACWGRSEWPVLAVLPLEWLLNKASSTEG